jgi:hypothetical protein
MLAERTLSISRPFPQLTIFPSGSSFKESRRTQFMCDTLNEKACVYV